MRRRRLRIQYRVNERAKTGILMLSVVTVIIVAALVKMNKSLKPVISIQAEHYAAMTANRVMENAVSEYIADKAWNYNDLVVMSYNGNGDPVSLELNSVNVNKIQSELSVHITDNLEKSSRSYHKIPLGSLTDSYLLSGKGPEVKIKICPLECVQVRIESKFDSAGINQTRHSVTAIITADISSSVPLYRFETKAEFDYLIAENIIIGKVPDIEKSGYH